MNIEVELVSDEKNGCADGVERKDAEEIQKVGNEHKEEDFCKISEKVEDTAGINKRRHSESEDENISTVKKIKHSEKMVVVEVNILESDNLNSSIALETTGTSDSNKKKFKFDSTTETKNQNTIVASTSDDQDDLLDRLDAIDSSGLRPPDLKLDEIDTSDLEKDDLLKRLEEAEGGNESESVTINTADDQILINEDLLLDGEILPVEKEEFEQPSSTNTDSVFNVEKVYEEQPVSILESVNSNANNDVEPAVVVDLDDSVSDSTEATEKLVENHVSESAISEVFTVDSTDEQVVSQKTIEIFKENLVNFVDSTNEKINNEVPSTSLSSTIKIIFETETIPSEEPNKIEKKDDVEVETCVDSTNEQVNKTDVDNDNMTPQITAEPEHELNTVDSTHEKKSTVAVADFNEIAVDSTNEEANSTEVNDTIFDSKVHPPGLASVEKTTDDKIATVALVDNGSAEPTISSVDCTTEPEKITQNKKKESLYVGKEENSNIKADDNIPLSSENNHPSDKDDVMDVDIRESSEAQPAVENFVESNKSDQIGNDQDMIQEIILNTPESMKSEGEELLTTIINSEIEAKESSEAQPLYTEKVTEIEMSKEIPTSSVSSSSKDDLPTKCSFEIQDVKACNIKEEGPNIENPSAEVVVSKPIHTNLTEEKNEVMDVDENLLADNEATDLCEQATAVVIDFENDEITSNVNEIDVTVKAAVIKLEDAARYSDSTASINSTSEEALINHNKETHVEESDKCGGNMSIDGIANMSKPLLKEKLFGNVMLMNNGSSTPNSNNTSVTTSNVFNSTPILKTFEISSENVSKISDNPKPCSSSSVIVLNDDTADTTEEEVTESDTPSSDGIANFAKSIIKLNGLSPSSSQSEDIKSLDEGNIPKDSLNGLNFDFANETSEEALYEVGIWYEENEMKYLAVEKLDRNKKFGGRLTSTSSSDVTGNESSDKRSSNGSIGSIGPFTLPQARLSAVSSNSSSSLSQKSVGKFAIPALPQRNKQTIKGISTLCTFMIDHFSKIKATLNQSQENQNSLTNTPKGRGKEATKKSLAKEHGEFAYEEKPQSNSKGNKRKADTSNDSVSTTDDEKTPKTKVSKKNAKSSNLNVSKQGHFLVPPSEVLDDTKTGLNVLARWVDKKYYAGKVVESKPGMKYVIKFEDGALKTLPQDLIVFGRDENVLPLLGHEVHALVENDEYEVGFVEESEIENGVIYYKILIDTKTIRVTSSDIYLTDDQAKSIQDVFKNISDLNMSDDKLNVTGGADLKVGSAIKGRPHRNVVQKPEVVAATAATGRGGRGKKGDKSGNETEAGFSGGIAPTKRGRKPKRPQPQSESSDVSDSLELDSAPNSPDSALEAINGVQPELQKTPKESQINKMCIMAEYLGTDKPDKNKNLEDLLGPIPNNKSLFRNKHFILTCTIAMKSPRPSSSKKSETSDDMKNKYRKFTSFPFIKEHLRKQIEEGGGKVYNHFEDIPKNKYKQCKLIAPSPCVTAKYVQCLAAEIPAISHEWIIESCRNNSLVDTKLYALPSGWSIIEERYIKWTVGRNTDQRSTTNPLSNQIVLMASQNKDFSDFWTRVCKLAGSTIRFVKTAADITQGQTGCMLTDEEFPQDIKSKAEHFGIPIVSTVWVVQSLILGKACKPDAHEKLTQIYQDDDY